MEFDKTSFEIELADLLEKYNVFIATHKDTNDIIIYHDKGDYIEDYDELISVEILRSEKTH